MASPVKLSQTYGAAAVWETRPRCLLFGRNSDKQRLVYRDTTETARKIPKQYPQVSLSGRHEGDFLPLIFCTAGDPAPRSWGKESSRPIPLKLHLLYNRDVRRRFGPKIIPAFKKCTIFAPRARKSVGIQIGYVRGFTQSEGVSQILSSQGESR